MGASFWNYASHGSNWPSDSNYPDCALNAQSPIDIPRTSLTNDYSTTTDIQGSYKSSKAQWDGYVTSLPSVTFSYTGGSGNYRVVNALNGRTITQRFGVLKNAKLLVACLMTVFALLFVM